MNQQIQISQVSNWVNRSTQVWLLVELIGIYASFRVESKDESVLHLCQKRYIPDLQWIVNVSGFQVSKKVDASPVSSWVNELTYVRFPFKKLNKFSYSIESKDSPSFNLSQKVDMGKFTDEL